MKLGQLLAIGISVVVVVTLFGLLLREVHIENVAHVSACRYLPLDKRQACVEGKPQIKTVTKVVNPLANAQQLALANCKSEADSESINSNDTQADDYGYCIAEVRASFGAKIPFSDFDNGGRYNGGGK